MMNAWRELEPEIFGPLYNQVWDAFEAKFNFPPKRNSTFVDPTPSVTYSISSLYNGDESHTKAGMNDINMKVLEAFQGCVGKEEALYVLDWQHSAYLFYPHVPFDFENLTGWRTQVVPNGDYYIFINQDFSFGTLGHPWEETICVFGEQLIARIQRNLPFAFEEIRRK